MSKHFCQSLSRWILLPSAVAALTFLSGCRQDMQNQPKMIPQRESLFFPSGRSVRPQVPGTVARNQGDADSYFQTGLVNNQVQDRMPFPVNMTVLRKGQERFNIYCTPCHSRLGNGRGMIVERGYKPAGNLLEPRIAGEPMGHYFAVITHGYGAMPDYAAQISVQDRWAIVAYIRALQLSQNATLQDVPPGTNVQKLSEVSEQMGYSAQFPEQWTLPELTNVPGAGDMHSDLVGQKQAMPASAQNAPKNSLKKNSRHTGTK